MKKLKRIAALGMVAFVLLLPALSVNAQGNGNFWCLFGRDGEEGTWMEGACIEEANYYECFTCISLD